MWPEEADAKHKGRDTPEGYPGLLCPNFGEFLYYALR
jgi:hypothetical protein